MTDDIIEWAKVNNASFAPRPTTESWLNLVECHIGAIGRMAFKNTNYTKWTEVEDALLNAIRYKNTRRKETLVNRAKRTRDRRKARKRAIWKFRTQNSVIETIETRHYFFREKQLFLSSTIRSNRSE